MTTLLLREHNRRAQQLALANPHADEDEAIFQEARKWVAVWPAGGDVGMVFDHAGAMQSPAWPCTLLACAALAGLLSPTSSSWRLESTSTASASACRHTQASTPLWMAPLTPSLQQWRTDTVRQASSAGLLQGELKCRARIQQGDMPYMTASHLLIAACCRRPFDGHRRAAAPGWQLHRAPVGAPAADERLV